LDLLFQVVLLVMVLVLELDKVEMMQSVQEMQNFLKISTKQLTLLENKESSAN